MNTVTATIVENTVSMTLDGKTIVVTVPQAPTISIASPGPIGPTGAAGAGGTDDDAIHDNVAGEISIVTAKGTPVAGDFLLIEDSAAANAKKSITMADIDHDALTNFAIGEHRIINDAGTSATELWSASKVDTAKADASHNHAAGDVNSGTLAHERGGIEADISAITTGGILYGSSAGAMSILPAGSDTNVLTQASGVPSWAAAAGGTVVAETFGGRLTLTTALPVTTSDVTAATTVYLTPHQGNQIALYSGSAWAYFDLTEISISVPATTDSNYDVFVYDSTGLTLEAVVWTNDTTRATAIVLQDGVYCKSGTLTKRYVGSFRTTGVSGQTEDSEAARFVWNYYNRALRKMKAVDATTSWTYTTTSWRSANNSTANRVEFVRGVNENEMIAILDVTGYDSVGGAVYVGIGLDTTSANSADTLSSNWTVNTIAPAYARYILAPALGYHYLQWVEYGSANGNFVGTAASGTQTSGLVVQTWA